MGLAELNTKFLNQLSAKKNVLKHLNLINHTINGLFVSFLLPKLRKQKMKVAMEESYKNRTNAKDFVLLDNYMCVIMLAVLVWKFCVCMFAGNKKYSTQCQEFCLFIIVCVCGCVCACVSESGIKEQKHSPMSRVLCFSKLFPHMCVFDFVCS